MTDNKRRWFLAGAGSGMMLAAPQACERRRNLTCPNGATPRKSAPSRI